MKPDHDGVAGAGIEAARGCVTQSITRRTMLKIVAFSGVSLVSIPPVLRSHPDHQLIELCRRYAIVQAEGESAYERAGDDEVAQDEAERMLLSNQVFARREIMHLKPATIEGLLAKVALFGLCYKHADLDQEVIDIAAEHATSSALANSIARDILHMQHSGNRMALAMAMAKPEKVTVPGTSVESRLPSERLSQYADVISNWTSKKHDTSEIATLTGLPESLVDQWIADYRDTAMGCQREKSLASAA